MNVSEKVGLTTGSSGGSHHSSSHHRTGGGGGGANSATGGGGGGGGPAGGEEAGLTSHISHHHHHLRTPASVTALLSSTRMPNVKRQKVVLSLGIFIGILGASLLVGFGVLYLKPYLQVRTMEEAECAVIERTDPVNVFHVTCMCSPDGGSSCHSRLPCLRLKVSLFDQNLGTYLDNVTIYDSYETFLVQQNTMQCSFHKCTRVIKKNYEAVKSFAARMTKEAGDPFKCYYEPSEPTYAILSVVTKATVVHTLFWPSLAVIVGLAILFANVFTVGEAVEETVRTAAVLPPDRLRARLNENRYKRVQAT